MTDPNTRNFILNERNRVLTQNPKAFAGNTTANAQYKTFLGAKNATLTSFQLEAFVGLVLSDASLDYGKNGTRFKIQQGKRNLEFLNHIGDVFREYTASDDSSKQLNRKNMWEFTSFKCSQFVGPATLFGLDLNNPPTISKGNTTATVKRQVTQNLLPYITPVAVAYWFGGDGGKADYTPNQGKGICFSTNGFERTEVEKLSTHLTSLGFANQVEPVQRKKLGYEIVLSGTAFDDFIEKVGPYIPESVTYKLPSPRSDKSRFGNMTQDRYEKIVSSHFKKVDWLHHKSRW
jgi:hypothetical protein